VQVAKTQAPWTQLPIPLGNEQTVPQAPQLFGSVARLVQVLPQKTDPLGQAAHVPFLQISSTHTVPQVPQLFASLFRSVQVPLQQAFEDGQHAHPQQNVPVEQQVNAPGEPHRRFVLPPH
jgi:hypothetical protein